MIALVAALCSGAAGTPGVPGTAAVSAVVAAARAAAPRGIAKPALAREDAAALFAAGKDEAALLACEAALAEQPDEPALLELRARCLHALGRVDAAAAALRALPRRSMALDLLLAECLAARAATAAEADELVARWAGADPNDPELRLGRARVHLAQRRAGPALADARFVVARAPDRFEAVLLLARASEASGRAEEAWKLAQPLLERPAAFTDRDVHLEREATAVAASAALRMQRLEEAIGLAARLVGDAPDVAAWRALLAAALGLRHRYAESIEQWERAVALDPVEGEYRWRLGDLYRSHGRTEDAIAQFDAMRAHAQHVAVAELRLGELYLERGEDGDLDRALEHLANAEELAPESGDVAGAKAAVHEERGELDLAEAAHRRAFERNPLRFESLYRLALLLARSSDEGARAESARLLERYRRIEPHLADLKKAKQDADMNPGSAAALTRMAGMLNLAGEYETARRFADRSAKIEPRAFANLVQTAYILANLGDLPGARQHLALALSQLTGEAATSEAAKTLQSYLTAIDRNQPLPLPLR